MTSNTTSQEKPAVTAKEKAAIAVEEWQKHYDILLVFFMSYFLVQYAYDADFGWDTFLAYLGKPQNPGNEYDKEYAAKGEQLRHFITNGQSEISNRAHPGFIINFKDGVRKGSAMKAYSRAKHYTEQGLQEDSIRTWSAICVMFTRFASLLQSCPGSPFRDLKKKKKEETGEREQIKDIKDKTIHDVKDKLGNCTEDNKSKEEGKSRKRINPCNLKNLGLAARAVE
jgi:hypothetical protein